MSASKGVFVDRIKVGSISYGGQGCIVLTSDVFLPELTKLVLEHGQNFIVKVADKKTPVKRMARSKTIEYVISDDLQPYEEL